MKRLELRQTYYNKLQPNFCKKLSKKLVIMLSQKQTALHLQGLREDSVLRFCAFVRCAFGTAADSP